MDADCAVIIINGVDITVHASVLEAQQYLEPVDVKAEEFQIVDEQGRHYAATVDLQKRPFLGDVETVRLTPIERDANQEREIADRMLQSVRFSWPSAIMPGNFQALCKLVVEHLRR